MPDMTPEERNQWRTDFNCAYDAAQAVGHDAASAEAHAAKYSARKATERYETAMRADLGLTTEDVV